jgi:glycine cleavage system H protein
MTIKIFPEELLYSREHHWVRVEGNLASVGITEHAHEKLGELYSIELSEMFSFVERDEQFGTLEANKTTLELISPVTGEVVNVNEELLDDVGIITSDPYDTGWLIVIEMSNQDELDDLLTAKEYREYLAGEL